MTSGSTLSSHRTLFRPDVPLYDLLCKTRPNQHVLSSRLPHPLCYGILSWLHFLWMKTDKLNSLSKLPYFARITSDNVTAVRKITTLSLTHTISRDHPTPSHHLVTLFPQVLLSMIICMYKSWSLPRLVANLQWSKLRPSWVSTHANITRFFMHWMFRRELRASSKAALSTLSFAYNRILSWVNGPVRKRYGLKVVYRCNEWLRLKLDIENIIPNIGHIQSIIWVQYSTNRKSSQQGSPVASILTTPEPKRLDLLVESFNAVPVSLINEIRAQVASFWSSNPLRESSDFQSVKTQVLATFLE